MKSVAVASRNRSISELKEALSKFENELKEDTIISSHLNKLYDNLLEQNLLRVIEPFAKVQVCNWLQFNPNHTKICSTVTIDLTSGSQSSIRCKTFPLSNHAKVEALFNKSCLILAM